MNEERQRQFAATHCRFADEGFPAAYVLDALDGTDLAQFRAHAHLPHLHRRSRHAWRDGGAIPLLIDETAPESQPTPALRQRLLDSVAAERPAAAAPPAPISFPAARRWAQPFAVAAVLLLALSLSLLAWNLNVQGDLRAARSERDQAVATIALTQQQLQQAQRERDQAQAALAQTRFQLAATAGQVASGTITYLPAQQQAVIVINDLPALASGQVYQLWLITGNNVQPSTVFLSSTTAVRKANPDPVPGRRDHHRARPTAGTAPTSAPIVTANLGGQ
ncbi:MAG: anti-sigma factor [Chloroflexia bacterium]